MFSVDFGCWDLILVIQRGRKRELRNQFVLQLFEESPPLLRCVQPPDSAQNRKHFCELLSGAGGPGLFEFLL